MEQSSSKEDISISPIKNSSSKGRENEEEPDFKEPENEPKQNVDIEFADQQRDDIDNSELSVDLDAVIEEKEEDDKKEADKAQNPG